MLDEAGDKSLNAGVFDRAVARARDDDQASMGEEAPPAAKVDERIERVSAARKQQRGHTYDAEAAGGTIHMGPHQVPTGDHVIIGQDPQGAEFALVGKR